MSSLTTSATSLPVAGIILCGGQSRRMGVAKATLPVGSESMLGRVVRLLSLAVQPIVVVAAPEQAIPQLPPGTAVVHDLFPGCGPLAGLQAGLTAVGKEVKAAYLTGCDAPLLVPGFVRRMVDLLDDGDVVVPVEGTRHHSLAAVYSTAVLPIVTQLLNESRYKTTELFDRVTTRRVEFEELRDVDPELSSLQNVNRPADYLAMLGSLGLDAPAGLFLKPDPFE